MHACSCVHVTTPVDLDRGGYRFHVIIIYIWDEHKGP